MIMAKHETLDSGELCIDGFDWHRAVICAV